MEKKERIFIRSRYIPTLILTILFLVINIGTLIWNSGDTSLFQKIFGYESNHTYGALETMNSYRYPDWNLPKLVVSIIVLYSLSIIIPLLEYLFRKAKKNVDNVKVKLKNDLIFGLIVCTLVVIIVLIFVSNVKSNPYAGKTMAYEVIKTHVSILEKDDQKYSYKKLEETIKSINSISKLEGFITIIKYKDNYISFSEFEELDLASNQFIISVEEENDNTIIVIIEDA